MYIDDPDASEGFKAEVRQKLTSVGFDGSNTPIIVGSVNEALEVNSDDVKDMEYTIPERCNEGDKHSLFKDVTIGRGRGGSLENFSSLEN